MKQLILRLIIASATFAAGATCAVSHRAVSRYQALQTKERVLREGLMDMRQAIDKYVAEYGYHPRSLDALVQEGHLLDVPIDPMTGRRDWVEERVKLCALVGEPTSLTTGVRSASTAISSEGTPYSEW
jgi:general secretion pathway protein G